MTLRDHGVGLQPGEAAVRSTTFTMPAGNYMMTLVINGGAPLTLGNVIVSDCTDSADPGAQPS